MGEAHGGQGTTKTGVLLGVEGRTEEADGILGILYTPSQPLPTHATTPSPWASLRTGLERGRWGQLPSGKEQPPERLRGMPPHYAQIEACCPTMRRSCGCKTDSS